MERLKKMIMFCMHNESKCGNNPNEMISLTMHNKLQRSMLRVTFFSIKILTSKFVITIPTFLFCSAIHSVAIIVSVCDLGQ